VNLLDKRYIAAIDRGIKRKMILEVLMLVFGI